MAVEDAGFGATLNGDSLLVDGETPTLGRSNLDVELVDDGR